MQAHAVSVEYVYVTVETCENGVVSRFVVLCDGFQLSRETSKTQRNTETQRSKIARLRALIRFL